MTPATTTTRRLPLICTVPEGKPCAGGCDFTIPAGEPVWEGGLCTFCVRWNRLKGIPHGQ